jgi:spore coat protein H
MKPNTKTSSSRRGSGGAGLRIVVALATAAAAAACVPHGDDSDRVYDPTRILDIRIEMDAADWEALRNEHPPAVMSPQNHGPACLPHNNPGFAYTTYEARVEIDGEVLDKVGIKKRTWCGSQSTEKPALKLDFNELVADREWHSTKGLTLNNSVQDPAYIRQCLAYQVFAAAGLPASRCNFARVSVNGAEPKLYVNVEPIKHAYLERELPGDSGEGNLYKGFLADFSPELVTYFEKEANEDDPDRTDLDAVAAALAPAVADTELEASVANVIDLPGYLSHWATEVLVAHADGYAGNTNNFLVYHADDGRFRFLPWGVDDTFGSFGTQTAFGAALLPSRLCAVAKTAGDYAAELRRVLDTAWDEAALRAEIDRMEALIGPAAGGASLAAEIDAVRSFVGDRRAAIEQALAGPTPCKPTGGQGGGGHGTVDATFSTTWGALDRDPAATGTDAIGLVLDGAAASVSQAGAVAGTGQLVLGARLADGATVLVVVPLAAVPAAGVPTQVSGVVAKAAAGGAPMPIGGLGATLTLTAAGTTTGATFAGSLTGSF